jgi:predicted TIM-barrel fold metal-dependent hydrolase
MSRYDLRKSIAKGGNMATSTGEQVIAIEEHYWDPELIAHYEDAEIAGGAGKLRPKLEDLYDERIAEMDSAGIDIQVLSHGAPSSQRLDPSSAAGITRIANDRLRDIVAGRPDRFSAFCNLPTPDPDACADELARCVNDLGMKGAMIHGLTNGVFFDDPRFWPIFERAQALDVPLYMHPAMPDRTVIERYYAPYDTDFPALLNAGWGFTVETATQCIRLVLSGVLDKYPSVKIIVGHLGEGLPFLLWRIDHALSRPGNKPMQFREVFSRNFYITTSGNFSDPALLCSLQEMGADRILFSVDWPFVPNAPGVEWIERVHLNAEDKAKILNGNAKRLLKL